MKPSEVVGLVAGLITTGTAVIYSLGTVVISMYGSKVGIDISPISAVETMRNVVPLVGFVCGYGAFLGMNIWDYKIEVSAETKKEETGRKNPPRTLTHLRTITWLFGNYTMTLFMAGVWFGFAGEFGEDSTILPALLISMVSHSVYLGLPTITPRKQVWYMLVNGAASGWAIWRITEVQDLFWPANTLLVPLIVATLLASERIQTEGGTGRRAVAQLAMLAFLTMFAVGSAYARGPLFNPLGPFNRTEPKCLFIPSGSTLAERMQAARVLLATGSALYVEASDGRNYRVGVDNALYSLESCDDDLRTGETQTNTEPSSSAETILREYLVLEPEDIRACLRFAQRSVAGAHEHDRLPVREALQDGGRRLGGRHQDDAEDEVGRIAGTEVGGSPEMTMQDS